MPNEQVVKEPQKDSTPEGEAKEEVSLDETDLKAFEEDKKVPYDRFKSVNESKKAIQKELEQLKAQRDEDVRRAVELAELRMKQSKSEPQDQDLDDDVEPWQKESRRLVSETSGLRKELADLKSDLSQSKLEAQIAKLKDKFPEADEIAVLGWRKAQPNRDLEELMEYSHTKNNERVESRLRSLIEKKKEKSKTILPIREGGIKLKPEEKPKNIREATKLLKKYI